MNQKKAANNELKMVFENGWIEDNPTLFKERLFEFVLAHQEKYTVEIKIITYRTFLIANER